MSTRLDLTKISALEHQLTEVFGPPDRFGVRLPLPPGMMAQAGQIVLGIVGADGEVSAREREAFLGILRSYGTPEKEIEHLRTFTPVPGMIDHVASSERPPFLRALVYDSIRVARVDGFAEKERATTIRVATRLGLETGLVRAIEAQLLVEDAVRLARHKLLQSPPDLTKTGYGGPPIGEGSAGRSNEYGSVEGGALPRDFLVRIGKAILLVAAGDGEITEPEWRWFLGQARTVGTPDDVLEEFLKLDTKYTRLEEVLDDRLRPFARGILFDALRTARADGVTAHERARAMRAADRLGLAPDFVVALENQLDVEAAVREARLHLLAPLR